MQGIPNTFAFTMVNEYGIANRLISDATVSINGQSVSTKALWDTGASGTCISYEVVHNLSLIPTGKQSINTPSGTSTVNTYLIDIILPNNVTIKNVVVCDSEIGKQKIGVLIGMDIINLGDFAVSNYNGTTSFSFRIPSRKRTDYVSEVSLERTIGQRHGKGKRKRK